MSRTAKIARGLTIGYGFQAIVALTGLVLTPFFLSYLGTENYGRWLVAGQILGLLGLLDLGVAGLVPRDVARASGSGNSDDIARVVSRSQWLIVIQTPVVAVVSILVWCSTAATAPDVSEPLAIVLVGFVVQFPLRLPLAVLGGLQDLAFVGCVQALSWAVTTAISVTLVIADVGLCSLAIGWTIGQVLGCLIARHRLRTSYPATRSLHRWPGMKSLLERFRTSLWMSLAQLAQVLTAGTDLVVIGWVLGPAAAVAYGCTVKLLAVLTNPCYSIGLIAQPALSELHASGDSARFVTAVRSVSTSIVVAGSAVAISAVSFSPLFVHSWVGSQHFAGPMVIALSAVALLLRLLAFSWWSVAYVMGHERALSIVLVVDGLVTCGAGIGWTYLIGPSGAPLGSITGAALVYAPTGLLAISRGLKQRMSTTFRWSVDGLFRFTLVFLPVLLYSMTSWSAGWQSIWITALALAIYAAFAYRLADTGPLRPHRDRAVAFSKRLLPRFAFSRRN